MRILLVSYHLHPDRTSEGLCVAKTVRALTDVGHEVVIVTSTGNALEGDYCVANTSLLHQIPVFRIAPAPNLVPSWSRALYRFAKLHAGNAQLYSKFVNRVSAVPGIVFGCNEEELSWVLAASRQIVSLCQGRKPAFDLIYSRLNHSNSHYAVLNALPHIRHRIPWVAHFSDPWPHHRYPGEYRGHSGWFSRLRLDGILRKILTNADSLTFPSERLLRYQLSGSLERFRGKAFAVPHLGNNWLAKPSYKKADRLSILHTGLLLKQRKPETFFKGLKLFLRRHPSAGTALDITFIGRNVELALTVARQFGVEALLHTAPHAEMESVWQQLCLADVLLLLESEMQEGIFMPSKLADYLSTGRPILALSPLNGTVADYLSNGGGIRVDPTNPEGIAAALADLYHRWREDRLQELAPSEAQMQSVAPHQVVDLYEAAFQKAIDQAGK